MLLISFLITSISIYSVSYIHFLFDYYIKIYTSFFIFSVLFCFVLFFAHITVVTDSLKPGASAATPSNSTIYAPPRYNYLVISYVDRRHPKMQLALTVKLSIYHTLHTGCVTQLLQPKEDSLCSSVSSQNILKLTSFR